jgi:hypothetical protein
MIGDTTNQAEYAGNASTSTPYVIPFRYDVASWVAVTVTNALGEITDLEQVTDYTLAGDGSTEDGTFTTIVAVPATSTVTVYRETPGIQSLSLPANTPLPAVAVEAALDRLAMAAADSVTQRDLAARLSAILIAAGVNITVQDLLDLLNGQTLEPGSIILPDNAGLLTPVGALGRLGDALSVLDNATAGGVLLTPRRKAGALTCDLTGTNKTSARFPIVGIPLAAGETLPEALVRISGTIKLLFSDVFYIAEDPVISANFGFAHAAYKTDAKTKWCYYNCLPTGTEFPRLITNHIDFRGVLAENPTAGADKIVLTAGGSVIVSERWAGADPGDTVTKNPGTTPFVDPSDTSVAITEATADTIWLCVEIVMGASGTNGALDFSVVYDIDTAVTLP